MYLAIVMNRSLFSDLKSTFKYSSSNIRFIIINAAVFLIISLISLPFYFANIDSVFNEIIQWFAIPSSPSLLIKKPWTLITYMFVHHDFFHLFFNMLMLFWAGRIFTEYLGDKRLVSTYLIGGIFGAALYLIAYNTLPVFQHINSINMGASGAVLAVLIAIATYLPNYSVFMVLIGPIKLKYIALILVLIDVLSIEKGNAGGHITHLGGAIYGYIYSTQLAKGRNIALWFDNTVNFFSNLFKPKSKLKVSYRRNEANYSENQNDYKSNQQKIDEILDKISKSGYESLSKSEKELLFKISKNL